MRKTAHAPGEAEWAAAALLLRAYLRSGVDTSAAFAAVLRGATIKSGPRGGGAVTPLADTDDDDDDDAALTVREALAVVVVVVVVADDFV